MGKRGLFIARQSEARLHATWHALLLYYYLGYLVLYTTIHYISHFTTADCFWKTTCSSPKHWQGSSRLSATSKQNYEQNQTRWCDIHELFSCGYASSLRTITPLHCVINTRLTPASSDFPRLLIVGALPIPVQVLGATVHINKNPSCLPIYTLFSGEAQLKPYNQGGLGLPQWDHAKWSSSGRLANQASWPSECQILNRYSYKIKHTWWATRKKQEGESSFLIIVFLQFWQQNSYAYQFNTNFMIIYEILIWEPWLPMETRRRAGRWWSE